VEGGRDLKVNMSEQTCPYIAHQNGIEKVNIGLQHIYRNPIYNVFFKGTKERKYIPCLFLAEPHSEWAK